MAANIQKVLDYICFLGKKRTFARLVNGLITPQTTISIALFCNMNKYILLYLTIYVLKYLHK